MANGTVLTQRDITVGEGLGATYASRGVAIHLPKVSSNTTTSSAVIGVLSGGATIYYSQPLTALTINSVVSSVAESEIIFSAGATIEDDVTTPCTLTLPETVRLLGSSAVTIESGGVYVLNFKLGILAMAQVFEQESDEE